MARVKSLMQSGVIFGGVSQRVGKWILTTTVPFTSFAPQTTLRAMTAPLIYISCAISLMRFRGSGSANVVSRGRAKIWIW